MTIPCDLAFWRSVRRFWKTVSRAIMHIPVSRFQASMLHVELHFARVVAGVCPAALGFQELQAE
jgi:hypothetical protein